MSRIRGFVHQKRKRDLIRKNLTVIWVNHRIRPVFREWRLRSRLSDQIQATKFQNMINLFMKNRQEVLRRALRKWSFRRGKNVIEILGLILKRIITITEKEAFDEIMNKVKISRMRDRMLAVQQMLKISYLYEQGRLFRAFHNWSDAVKSYNPWFKKAASLAAKNTPINFQIAFWRLRDASHESGTHFTAVQIAQCQKIYNFVKTLYERTVGRSFWKIEKTKRELDISAISLDNADYGTNQVEKRQEKGMKQEDLEEFAKRKVASYILKRILRRFETNNDEKRNVFDKWRMLSGSGKTALVEKMKGQMKNYEIDFVTKIGATNVLFTHLKAHWLKTLKGSFDVILINAQIVIKLTFYNN